ncbi:HNH endonuclease [Sphingobacterium yanglingense]|uniref:Putative restriction endonuclease n=1 Tax=Sphingobacterium yanglingense TaxID=1437280 RepID=A0A4R6WHY3_9SPHI|nr:HNH endonuclease [Sphingobacterium yanglingense]TDQ79764.1 putative restriction endonuclease [Sphingobacterium yanglingense]
MDLLDIYIRAFGKLKRGVTPYGLAPHKPILLLTLIELIDKGLAIDNRFEVNVDLVGLFQENWRLLVHTSHQSDFTQPFYYLQSDKANGQSFWELHPYPGFQVNAHIKSVQTLSQTVAYGSFNAELFQLLTLSTNRVILRDTILSTYFPDRQANYYQQKEINDGYYHDVQALVLNEPEMRYKHVSVQTEEDVFVRSGLFKRYIPQLYQDTCAMTGMRMRSTFKYNFIDACHIVPFAATHDDKVTNGIALCPNLHRAFDRGLVSIDEDYLVIVSSHIEELEDHPYSLVRLAGKQIILPHQAQYYPSQENLAWHRSEVFKD